MKKGKAKNKKVTIVLESYVSSVSDGYEERRLRQHARINGKRVRLKWQARYLLEDVMDIIRFG